MFELFQNSRVRTISRWVSSSLENRFRNPFGADNMYLKVSSSVEMPKCAYGVLIKTIYLIDNFGCERGCPTGSSRRDNRH